MRIGYGSGDWSQTVLGENGHPVWGGSSWARMGQYVGKLHHEVVPGILCKKNDVFGIRDWDGNFHYDLDVIVMKQVMFADLPDAIEKATANGQVIVNDIDDWYWGLPTSNRAFVATHPKADPLENVNHYKRIVARSSHVTVSTPELADRISGWVKCPVSVITNTVDTAKFKRREVVETEKPTIGWVGSTAHRAGDLETIRGIVGPLVRSGGFGLHHSGFVPGAPLVSEVFGLAEDEVSLLPLVEPELYPEVFVFDIGIVPLSRTPFNECKSFIKGLEYAAAGIPFVASSSREYKRLASQGIGLIADKPIEWKKLLMKMKSASFRSEVSETSFANLPQYDISKGAADMDAFFSSLA
jgi:hypothetical protein